MSTVAKASITITAISDAYSVSLSPNACIIHADFDGSNPVLTNAYTLISVYCGETKVPFTISDSIASSAEIQFAIVKIDDYTYRVHILQLSSNILDGSIEFNFVTNNGVHLTGKYQFTIERESTMLDWIQEWENGKTTIGEASIITPKLFVGKKITGSYDSLADVPGLTGVYIGPSSNDSCGIYGYKNSVEIFHLDETGGKIGGWDINDGGLSSSDGKLRILSDGSICAINTENNVIWQIKSDGSANFALGNVRFDSNGNAYFNGAITTSQGNIAGWAISTNQIYKGEICLDASEKVIGVARDVTIMNIGSEPPILSNIMQNGGVAIHYTSGSNWGLKGYSSGNIAQPAKRLFELGSQNFIAGWNFDENALWLGTKNNNVNQYTDDIASLTIGTKGLRGYSWYINTDGTASFVKGLVTFGTSSGTIVGWTLTDTKIATDNIALTSASGVSGLYMTASTDGKFIDRGSDAMENFIVNYGGIYLTVKSDKADFAAYDFDSHRLFQIQSNGTNYIAGWCFDNTSLWTGTQATSGFTTSGNITISPSGLRGHKWRLENDGSGAIAGGNISWDELGNVTFSESVSLSWVNISGAIGNKLTKIDANGIYTGTLSADQITTGTIDASKISATTILSNGNAWALNKDGSGYLANKNITWDLNGNTELANLKASNCVFTNVKINGTVNQPWTQSSMPIVVGGNDTLSFDNIAAGSSGGWDDGNIDSMLTWTLKDSGRIVRIAHWKWENEEFTGVVTLNAPSGKYFFEDGIAKTQIRFSREIITLMGYADSATFYGWVVVSRINFNTTNSYGRMLRALVLGNVVGGSTPTMSYKTFDNSALSIARIGAGNYKISFPSNWGLVPEQYQVMLTGISSSFVQATVTSQSTDSFQVQISNGTRAFDGSFQFQIFNLNDWI